MAPVVIWITCRDYERYLKLSLSSAIAQSVIPTRIYIAHDNCGKANPVGAAANRNKVFAFDVGVKYIMFLDADDVLPANYLEELLKVANGADCVVTCPAQLMGDENRFVPVHTPITLDTLLEGNTIHCSALIPYEKFKEAGGFDPLLPSHEDWDLWLRMSLLGVEFRNCISTHLLYRRHEGSRSSQNRENFWKMKQQFQSQYQKVN